MTSALLDCRFNQFRLVPINLMLRKNPVDRLQPRLDHFFVVGGAVLHYPSRTDGAPTPNSEKQSFVGKSDKCQGAGLEPGICSLAMWFSSFPRCDLSLFRPCKIGRASCRERV